MEGHGHVVRVGDEALLLLLLFGLVWTLIGSCRRPGRRLFIHVCSSKKNKNNTRFLSRHHRSITHTHTHTNYNDHLLQLRLIFLQFHMFLRCLSNQLYFKDYFKPKSRSCKYGGIFFRNTFFPLLHSVHSSS